MRLLALAALVLTVVLGATLPGAAIPRAAAVAEPSQPAPLAASASTSASAAASASSAPRAAATGPPIGRLAGPDRYASAAAISGWAFSSGSAPVVYLARGDDFSDALTAGALADGPILLLRGVCGTVPSPVRAEIARLDPARVVAIGGVEAVCDTTLQQAADGRPTERVSGATRHETAAAIARRAFPDGSSRVYLTRGTVTPDAVVGGSLRDGPVLLLSADGSSVPSATRDVIRVLAPSTVVALGGTSAVSQRALTDAAAGRATARLAGSNRYATAAAIAEYAYPSPTARVYLARGDGTNFVDAVASGMLTDGPVLLTPGPCERVRREPSGFLAERGPGRVVALGGSSALCTSLLRGASLEARPTPDCSRTACVALTFDDGPAQDTPELLDILAAERVPATFFVVGQQVDRRPAMARRTHVEGHTVANHSWSHPELPPLTRAEQRSQLTRVDQELAQHGIPATRMMRPPYGAYDADTRALGYPLVIWDVDPEDWRGYSAARIRQHVTANVRAGSIVLQHDLHGNSVDAVRGIIDDLHARGFTLVTVDELVVGMRPGEVVFRRGAVAATSQAASPETSITLPDGTDSGPLVDESGVEGIAPSLTEAEILDDD